MARKAKQTPSALQLKYVRSAIGRNQKQKRVIRGLGFRRLNQIVERPDTPEIRGMLAKVSHLVTVLSNEQHREARDKGRGTGNGERGTAS